MGDTIHLIKQINENAIWHSTIPCIHKAFYIKIIKP